MINSGAMIKGLSTAAMNNPEKIIRNRYLHCSTPTLVQEM